MLAAKAARGAGAGWGVAEDVARAVRWLAERGFGWSDPLLDLLAGDLPTALREEFRTADLTAAGRPGDRWTAAPCHPVWALPILAAAIHGRAIALNLTCDAGRFRLLPDSGASAEKPWPDLARSARQTIAIEAEAEASALAHRAEPSRRRVLISPATWNELGCYAVRTYVPASAVSRAKGAGGSGIDDE